MSFDQLATAIAEAANQEVSAAKQRAGELMAQEKARIAAAAEALEETIIQEATRTGELTATRIQQDQLLTTKANILAAKQQALTELENALVEQLLADETAAEALLEKLLSLLPNEEGTIVAGERHHDALIKLLKNSQQYQLTDQTVADDGGFIYRNNTAELHLTIRELVTHLFEQHRARIAHSLFS